MVPDIRTSGPSGPAGADSPRALSVSGPAGGTISIWLVLAYPVRWLSGVYCETGHPVSGPSGYQYPTDWYPIRSGPGTEIDFGVIRPDAPDYLTGPVTTPVKMWDYNAYSQSLFAESAQMINVQMKMVGRGRPW